jgi:hypothetical protein
MTTDAIGGSAPRSTPAIGAADLVCLAAAPTFAVMALLTVIPGGAHAMLCEGMHDASRNWASPLSGMTGMYLLMSAFHSAPWLRLLGRR